MQPTSSPSSDDILEGLTKAIREFARDIEQLEVTRHEDNVTLRELEIGVLKGPFTSLKRMLGAWLMYFPPIFS
jgi:hypothetical protein